jgi:excinuclease ABC subunit A
MSKQPCPACNGTKLCAEARSVLLGNKPIAEVSAMPVDEVLAWLSDLLETLPGEALEIGGEALNELGWRLQFLLSVGLHYLTLDRPAATLSGGEGQRIRLASQIGLELVGLLYVLDEPSVGLHARDQQALIDALKQVRDMGNTVLVVEHDEATMRAADWLIDMGPGAGDFGGEVVAEGTPERVASDGQSLTGRYLRGELSITAPNGGQRRKADKGWLALIGARLHNLQHVDAYFPLGLFTCITGVSGSGKSSLVADTLYPALQNMLHESPMFAGPYERLAGGEQIKKVITITQEPIGRTPRSNPATYVGVFDLIRWLFAQTPLAQQRGYEASRFSFNVKGGCCEACQGLGQCKINMHFLSDVWITCKECKGKRFNAETLEILYRGKTIAEVLDLDVQQALTFFNGERRLVTMLQTLQDVGLGYIKLGQAATTLSGGEAQRIKLAGELCRPSSGNTLYVLDEPTTGLHFSEVQRLLNVLHRLVDKGNTVIVVEHNLDVIKTADWVIDLGPEGGAEGGRIVAAGPPEKIAQTKESYTGKFLREVLR